MIYGDASGNQLQTTGSTDYQIIREYFARHYGAPVSYKVPQEQPGGAGPGDAGEREAEVGGGGDAACWWTGKCKELMKDFEQVVYKADSNQIDKDKDRKRTHVSDALGYLVWQECRPVATVGERATRLI